MKVPFYRRQFLINKRFQLAFMAFMFCVSLGVNFIFTIAINSAFRRFEEWGRAIGTAPDHAFFGFLKEQHSVLNWVLIFTFIASSIFILSVGLLFSHRIAGPIERLRRHLRARRPGEAEVPIRFRKGDFFQELASDYNSSIQN